MAEAQQRGNAAEEQACSHLERQGLRLVTRNFRAAGGEVDLIMRDGAHLVFVEVRYRRSARYGSGAESVDSRKQSKLVNAALYYLQRHPEQTRHPTRFDVISLSETGIEWIKNAFQSE
jgi:putative endonuclease